MKKIGNNAYYSIEPDENGVIRRFPDATSLFYITIEQAQKNNHFEPFLTIPAYEHILREGR